MAQRQNVVVVHCDRPAGQTAMISLSPGPQATVSGGMFGMYANLVLSASQAEALKQDIHDACNQARSHNAWVLRAKFP